MQVSRSIKNRGVFVKLFGSYLLLLGLILVVETGISMKVLDASKKQAATLNQSLMQIVKNECDNQLKNVYRSLDLLAFDNRVQVLSGVRGKFQAQNQYMAYSLYEELLNLRFSSDGYEHIYVYFSNTDSVISDSGNMSLEMYYKLYYQDTGISLKEFRDFLSQKHYHHIEMIAGQKILYSMTSLKTDVGEPTATMIVQMLPDAIDEKISAAKWDDVIQVAVVNTQNEILNSVGFSEEMQALKYDDIPTGESFVEELNHKKYMGIAMQSDLADWIYVLLTPKNFIEKGAKQIEKYCFIGLMVCMVIGFLSAYYLTDKNYNPVRELINLFQKENNGKNTLAAAEVGNEYQWLENQAKNFFQEHESIQRSLDKNQQRLGDFCLYKLMSQPYEELDTSEIELLHRKGITGGIFRVVFLSIGISPEKENGNFEKTEASQEMTQELKRFIIRNVAGEALNEAFQTEILEIENRVVALVHLDGMNKENYDRMWAALAKAFDVIRDSFHFRMQICSGTAKEGMENVYDSYLEAQETEQYAPLLDTYFINYNDIKDRSKKYYYPREVDAKILSALMAGNAESVSDCVKEILRINYQQNRITAKLLPCLVYDVLGTLMKGADEIGCGDFFEQYWENYEGFEQLSQKTLDEIEEQFTQLITALCREREKAKSGGDTKLADMIQSYISENFRDPDLNISQAALYFKKTPAYISSVYKKQTGKSLLKSITQLRVEEAVRLLGEGKSVNETAVLCGFRDSRNFIRVFKENTGMTPGQMRRE